MIVFKHEILRGKTCVVGNCFAEKHLSKMCDKAKELGLLIHITSSFRKDDNVKGAIVTPAKRSNHMVGHAIDCNFIENGKTWNSKSLENPTGKVKKLIDYCESIGMRWGGRFPNIDTVHFDDGINVNFPDLWASLYNTIKNNDVA